MKETTTRGVAALAEVFRHLGAAEEDPEATARAVWPEFKQAVVSAQAELKAEQAAGLSRWREERHAPKQAAKSGTS